MSRDSDNKRATDMRLTLPFVIAGLVTAAIPAGAQDAERRPDPRDMVRSFTARPASTVAEWSNIPEYRAGLERTLGPDAVSRLHEVVTPRLPSFEASARRLNDSITAIVAAARSARSLSDKRLSA